MLKALSGSLLTNQYNGTCGSIGSGWWRHHTPTVVFLPPKQTTKKNHHTTLRKTCWCILLVSKLFSGTLPETNMAPENGPSQKEMSLPTIIFRGQLLVSGRVTWGKLEVLKILELPPQASPVVEDLLDASGRERLLIGPTTGLVTCPDFDVRCHASGDHPDFLGGKYMVCSGLLIKQWYHICIYIYSHFCWKICMGRHVLFNHFFCVS